LASKRGGKGSLWSVSGGAGIGRAQKQGEIGEFGAIGTREFREFGAIRTREIGEFGAIRKPKVRLAGVTRIMVYCQRGSACRPLASNAGGTEFESRAAHFFRFLNIMYIGSHLRSLLNP